MDVKRHVDHWHDGSVRALDCVSTLLTGGFVEEGLFWAHLAVEKALKAHVIQQTSAQPPYIHNLIRLAEIAGLNLTPEQNRLCIELLEVHITGRYFEDGIPPVPPEEAQDLVLRTREFHAWLIKQL